MAAIKLISIKDHDYCRLTNKVHFIKILDKNKCKAANVNEIDAEPLLELDGPFFGPEETISFSSGSSNSASPISDIVGDDGKRSPFVNDQEDDSGFEGTFDSNKRKLSDEYASISELISFDYSSIDNNFENSTINPKKQCFDADRGSVESSIGESAEDEQKSNSNEADSDKGAEHSYYKTSDLTLWDSLIKVIKDDGNSKAFDADASDSSCKTSNLEDECESTNEIKDDDKTTRCENNWTTEFSRAPSERDADKTIENLSSEEDTVQSEPESSKTECNNRETTEDSPEKDIEKVESIEPAEEDKIDSVTVISSNTIADCSILDLPIINAEDLDLNIQEILEKDDELNFDSTGVITLELPVLHSNDDCEEEIRYANDNEAEDNYPEYSSADWSQDDTNNGTLNDDHRLTFERNDENEVARGEDLENGSTIVEEDKKDDIKKKEVKKPNTSTPKRYGDAVIIDAGLIIPVDSDERRAVTRLHKKTCAEKPKMKMIKKFVAGKLVWGCFAKGWWPAMIVKAEDVGQVSNKDRVWVMWLGEESISELLKRNVDSFSNDFNRRLNFLANPSSKSTMKKEKEAACLSTIKLLRNYFNVNALTRPYSTWLKNNIAPHKHKLDDLIFYPYPERYATRLAYLNTINCEKTKKFLRYQEKIRTNMNKDINFDKVQEKKPTAEVEKPEKMNEGGINIGDQKAGMVVWGKMGGYKLWPAVVMDYRLLNKRPPQFAHQWVMWYGDYLISQINYNQIMNFPTGLEKMKNKVDEKRDKLYASAVLQAAKDYYKNYCDDVDSWSIKDVIDNFSDLERDFASNGKEPIDDERQEVLPESIQKRLIEKIYDKPVNDERRTKIVHSRELKLALSNDLPIDSICIGCLKKDKVDLEEHPFFHVSLCTNCLEEFRPKVYAYGDDGKSFYCSLCGLRDLVVMCDDVSCPRVFCTACIEHIISPGYHGKILLEHPWYCFLCEPKSPFLKNSIIKVRDDWKDRLMSLFPLNTTPNAVVGLKRSKKIRVLSLFDGIGTGLLVLKNLNIQVDCYYASEIDADSMLVSRFNHGSTITQLGDVRGIKEAKIKEIAPIDLLIGGSPCNELSIANPKRRGLDDPAGTGVLFYDYVRIKKLLAKHNKKHQFYWLFENVASMPKKYRSRISECLECEPQFLDSAIFSAQHRPRLFWGNIQWGPYRKNDVLLQDCLNKNCNRQALVKKIATITTRQNSLNQTKENLKPVLMDGKKDVLWVNEIEEIFGFPKHYTDTNIQKTRRLRLLGKSWSVQTLVAVLQPLFKD